MTATLEHVAKIADDINKKLDHITIYIMIVDGLIKILIENRDTEELTAVYEFKAGEGDTMMKKLTKISEVL